MVFVCLFYELGYLLSSSDPDREDVIYILFPKEQFDCAFVYYLCLNLRHKNVSESYRHLRTHGGTVYLEIIFFQ